ncbi:MAG: hypothetical protein RL536_280 [Candidatus Parcubacteria bacterium]|jgi:hypothetical protein
MTPVKQFNQAPLFKLETMYQLVPCKSYHQTVGKFGWQIHHSEYLGHLMVQMTDSIFIWTDQISIVLLLRVRTCTFWIEMSRPTQYTTG